MVSKLSRILMASACIFLLSGIPGRAQSPNAQASPKRVILFMDGMPVIYNSVFADGEDMTLAQSGNIAGEILLGDTAFESTFKDTAGMLKWWHEAAEDKMQAAINRLGMASRLGFIPQEPYVPEAWYAALSDQAIKSMNVPPAPSRDKQKLYTAAQAGDIGAQYAVNERNWYDQLAAQGMGAAQMKKGEYYLKGEVDPKKAISWYTKAAEQGMAVAQYNLASLYMVSEGKPDYASAAKWYRKAADQGFTLAQSAMGDLYEAGLGVPQDHAEAARWYGLAEKAGYGPMQRAMDFALKNGRASPSDVPEAARPQVDNSRAEEIFKRAVEARKKGDYKTAMQLCMEAQSLNYSPAQMDIAYFYARGLGVKRDIPQAIEWYKKAAAGLMPGAASHAAFYYQFGLGVPRDLVQAAKLYEQELDLDFKNNNALQSAGWIYLYGGLPGGYAKAMALYEKAAAHGNFAAYNNLGMIYLYGMGVPADTQKALYWYAKSADRGDATGSIQASWILIHYEPHDYKRAFEMLSHGGGSPVAMNNLGYMYEHSLGPGVENIPVDQRKKAALDFYESAAGVQGGCYSRAMYNAGRMYDAGEGAAKDPARARDYMQKGAMAGSKAAAQWLLEHPEKGTVTLSQHKAYPTEEIGLPPRGCRS